MATAKVTLFTETLQQMRKKLNGCKLAHPFSLEEAVKILSAYQFSLELVTPTLAKTYLKLWNEELQRKWRPGTSDAYNYAMSSGQWQLNPEPIIFLKDGSVVSLGNGKHRLEALVSSNTAALFLVIRGVPKEVMKALDIGLHRSNQDVLRLGYGRTADASKIGVVTNMLKGFRRLGRKLTAEEINRCFEDHDEAIEFAIKDTPSNFRQAPWRAVIARAFYHLDHKVLRRFKEVMFTGNATEEEKAAATLGTYITRNKHGGGSAQTMLYAFTETCVAAFAEGVAVEFRNYSPFNLPKKHITREELYLLPEEQA